MGNGLVRHCSACSLDERTDREGNLMTANGPRRGKVALFVGIALALIGALVILVSQSVFAAKSVRLHSYASGNTFTVSDEQMLKTMPFAETIIDDGDGVRQRIFKRRVGTAAGTALIGVGVILMWFGLRRRKAPTE